MKARLSFLLAAGGAWLAGSLPGALQAAPPTAVSKAPRATLEAASLVPQGDGACLVLRIPGFGERPGLQVLGQPHRVVIDLPGVLRGETVTRADLAALAHGPVLKARLAQNVLEPRPVTRLVLEVRPGTQAQVSTGPDGLEIQLIAGEGAVQARHGAPLAPGVETLTPLAVPALAPEPAVAKAEPAPSVAVPVPPAPVPDAPQAAPVVAKAEPAPAVPVSAPPAPVMVPAPKAEPRALAALPVAPGVFHPLPRLAAVSLPAASPEGVQVPEPEKPAAQAPRIAGRTLGESHAKYTGARVSIDVPNMDIREFLRILAETGKLNLVMDPDVQGTYGFKFQDTPWDQVLDIILKHAALGKEIQNGVLRVAKVEKLQKEEEDRKKLDETRALGGDLTTITRPLSYAKVVEVQRILKEVLTKRGTAIVDERTSTLIITDLPRNIPVIDDLLQTLDVQIQQVQIEARVVEANKNWQQEFGVKWPQANSGNAAISSGSTSSGTSTTSTPWVGTTAPFWNGANGLNRPASGQQAAVGWTPGKDGSTTISAPAGELWLSFISNRFSVNAILQAMQSEGTLKIVSSPKIVTQNNKKATILSGEKIPYPTQQGGAQGGAITVAFIDANLQLEVTPQITNEGTIIMDLKVEKAEADFTRTVNGTPTILRKALETQILVRDGATAVLGGVYVTNSSTGRTGVPFLANLPLIGFLFRNDLKQDKNVELLIFITPRVVRQ